MKRIIVSNIVSIDGYFEGSQGMATLGAELNMDAAFDAYNLERIRAADTVLLGSRTYAAAVGYWPGVQDHPGLPSDDPMSRAFDETNRAISRRYDQVDVVVVSRNLVVTPDVAWAEHTDVLPPDDVASWKAAGTGEAVVFGSRLTWNGLLARGLVDELHLMVAPNALGAGTAAFEGPTSLVLEGTRRFEDSDNVLLVYRPRGS